MTTDWWGFSDDELSCHYTEIYWMLFHKPSAVYANKCITSDTLLSSPKPLVVSDQWLYLASWIAMWPTDAFVSDCAPINLVLLPSHANTKLLFCVYATDPHLLLLSQPKDPRTRAGHPIPQNPTIRARSRLLVSHPPTTSSCIYKAFESLYIVHTFAIVECLGSHLPNNSLTYNGSNWNCACTLLLQSFYYIFTMTSSAYGCFLSSIFT